MRTLLIICIYYVPTYVIFFGGMGLAKISQNTDIKCVMHYAIPIMTLCYTFFLFRNHFQRLLSLNTVRIKQPYHNNDWRYQPYHHFTPTDHDSHSHNAYNSDHHNDPIYASDPSSNTHCDIGGNFDFDSGACFDYDTTGGFNFDNVGDFDCPDSSGDW